MESRACYGWYGEGNGASGETKVRHGRSHKLGTFRFIVDWHLYGVSNKVEVNAMDLEHAERNVKAWAKRDGGTFLGEDPEYIISNKTEDEWCKERQRKW